MAKQAEQRFDPIVVELGAEAAAEAGVEVALLDRYHQLHNDHPDDSPLYGERGLFRANSG